MRFRESMQRLLGTGKESTLEYKLFLSTLIVGIFISLIGTVVSLILFSDLTVVIVTSSLLLIFGVLFYVVKFKGIYKPFVAPTITLAFMSIGLVWITDGGIDGTNLIVGFVALVLALVIVPNHNKKYVIISYLSLVLTLYLIQLYRPAWITPFATERARWIDGLITTLYSSVFIFFIVRFMHNAYTAERKKARDNELRFRALSENSQDSISRYDREYRHTYINKAGLELRGLSLDQVLGKTHREAGFLDKEQCDQFEATIEKTFETKQSQNGQFTIDRPGGRSYYDWRLYPEFNSENKVTSVLGVSRDITDLKHSERDLLQLNLDKDRFISILGHDLKGPLYTTLEISELLSANIKDYEQAELETILTEMSQSLRITYNLLEDIVTWTKAQSGKVPFEPKEQALDDICGQIVELLGPKATAKNIDLVSEITSSQKVYADPDMLKTILRNLVSNAVKFTNEGGKILIKAEDNSNHTALSIADNGIGISQKNLDKLFNITEFFSTKGTSQEKGTGLGLMLCKEFVENHKGKIWVKSEVGKGSTFSFTLPKS